METKPLDLAGFNARLADTVDKALGLQSSSELADDLDRAANVLATKLTHREDEEAFGYSGWMHFVGGFQLAVRLCCWLSADPVDLDSVKIEIDGTAGEIEAVMAGIRSGHHGRSGPDV